MEFPKDWQDFELLDSGDGEKLERWGQYILRRPDPQAIWNKDNRVKEWNKSDMIYHRSNSGGGRWEVFSRMPSEWQIEYKSFTFNIKPTQFKHTGLFPEQAVNWEKLSNLISKRKKVQKEIKVLNLFAYTGGATVACTAAGAQVTHIDASKGMTSIARQNIIDSGLDGRGSRFIVEDVLKFVERENRRGNKYSGIIMDPPAYGRGPTGQLWEIEKDLSLLVAQCVDIMEDPLFFLINAYATSFSSTALENILKDNINNLNIESGEVGIKDTNRGYVLPAGLYGLAVSND